MRPTETEIKYQVKESKLTLQEQGANKDELEKGEKDVNEIDQLTIVQLDYRRGNRKAKVNKIWKKTNQNLANDWMWG